MMYISEIIMLCTLNLYRDVCQFYLNKTGRKNGKKNNKVNRTKWRVVNSLDFIVHCDFFSPPEVLKFKTRGKKCQAEKIEHGLTVPVSNALES